MQLATVKADGTLRQPVTIWVVRVGDALYIRAYRGRAATWFRQIQQRPEGRIEASGWRVPIIDGDRLAIGIQKAVNQGARPATAAACLRPWPSGHRAPAHKTGLG